jgi:serine/threonine protein kinase/Tol biopolymer transport system component
VRGSVLRDLKPANIKATPQREAKVLNSRLATRRSSLEAAEVRYHPLEMAGRTLSHFEVLEKIGEGGMGVVYKARDTSLNRLVALKLLPPGKVADPERRRRFIQEARAASSLNHPNIVTIYEISQADGEDFIAMEFIAGRTLDLLIPRGGMKLNEALRIAVPVAEGLARAHEAGIVHRDLKPSNIIVGENSGQPVVKILDFGLAKLSEVAPMGPEDATITEARVAGVVRTDEGTLLGTVAYMSPEQAEGKPVTACSDIFSFGAVLYEMLTGRRAFQGANKQATFAAVMRDEPAPIPQIPHGLDKLIARCLRKDPLRRAQHMADIRLELEELKEESEPGVAAGSIVPPRSQGKRTRWLQTLAIVIGLVMVAGGILWWNARGRAVRDMGEMRSMVLTSYSGEEREPALSPDGKQVAFSWNGEKGDNFDIYVKLVDAGNPVRLTHDPAFDSNPVWSPDGSFIAFLRLSLEGKRGGYYVIPALGGAERKILDLPRVPTHRPIPSLDWTPDSQSLVVVDTSFDPPSLAQVSVADGGKVRLTSPPANSYGDYGPAVSPDGRRLAFDRAGAMVQDWIVVPLRPGADTGKMLHLGLGQSPFSFDAAFTTGSFSSVRSAWTPDSAHLVFAESSSGGTRLVWVAAAEPGRTNPILAAGTDVHSPSIARQSGRLAYVHVFRTGSLWRADLQHPIAPAARLIASTRNEMQPDYSTDGARIAFISTRSGQAEVWTANADGSNPVQITNGAARPTAPRWSPDGQRIVFAQRPGGNVDVYVINAQGGTPRRMTTDPAGDATAYWSRDGKWIYFASNRTGRQEVWRIPSDGSTREVQVTHNGGWRSRESFDGKTLYYQKFDLPGLFRIPIDGGPEERVADVQPPEDWQLASTGIYYFRRQGEGYVVDKVDLASGRITEALKLPTGATGGVNNFAVSPDGRWIVFAHYDHLLSELMMIENFH